jgi:hypothetical protein
MRLELAEVITIIFMEKYTTIKLKRQLIGPCLAWPAVTKAKGIHDRHTTGRPESGLFKFFIIFVY